MISIGSFSWYGDDDDYDDDDDDDDDDDNDDDDDDDSLLQHVLTQHHVSLAGPCSRQWYWWPVIPAPQNRAGCDD